ncbi:hypothetical protein LX99_02235 [Mucilaginibacter oryzae]|uniref:Uncharacterized protein n=2 Tax=Mucilaginibacter oryzae TaxID=468058 RepID=A0A316HED6_9SPHI|nr:hypothetical protein LX99_02235 [Mucilaginibacter oryzae]
MKKPVCFSIAFLASVLMFLSAAIFIRLNTGLMQPFMPAGFFMIAVQAVCALKFALLVIILMPNKPALTQVASGFVSADMLIMYLCLRFNGSLTLPVAPFTVQVLFIVYYMTVQGRLWIYKTEDNAAKVKGNLSPAFKSRLI